MRFAIVTETYPPEVNGVALTVQGLETGLRQRGHAVSLVRPRQAIESEAADDTLLVRGARLPRYPGLKFGLPATRRLLALWKESPPDAIYVATEGPLGWSAVRAAHSLTTSPISRTASMLMPALVVPTLTEPHTFSVSDSARGIERMSRSSPVVIPFWTRAEKPPM